jgi:hypothetical protein
MGAPFGNQNAAKAKLWTAAIERATARLATGQTLDPNDDRSDFVKGLDRMAEQFVGLSVTKDAMQFFREFGDRLEGKPTQATEISGANGGPLVIGWKSDEG